MVKFISDYRKMKTREYKVLVKKTFKSLSNLKSLKKQANAAYGKIFKGVWVQNNILVSVSINFGQNEPCLVCVYKDNGTNDDVAKQYCCPYFDSEKKCKERCQYRSKNNKYLELVNELIPNAEKDYKLLVEARQATLQEVLKGKKNKYL